MHTYNDDASYNVINLTFVKYKCVASLQKGPHVAKIKK